MSEIVDTYANRWRLTDGRLEVCPADTGQWRPAPDSTDEPASEAGWQFVQPDWVGFVWRARADRLERLDPHSLHKGWHVVDIGPSRLTALGHSADGLTLASFDDGSSVEFDIDAEGEICRRLLGQAPPNPPTWQSRARLPGGNHDLFAIEYENRLWMAGGLTHGWGLPARMHVFDELLAYDPSSDRWQVVSHMPFPRCYSGIAQIEGTVWIVGGAANLSAPDDPDGPREPLADVQLYDVAADTWRAGPSLSQARLESVVLVAHGRIWAIGGSDGDGLDIVESIGPGEAQWRREPSPPHAVNQADGCVVDGVLYVMSKAGFLGFEPQTGEWDGDLPQLEVSPQAAQVTAHNGEIWVMGGSRRRDTHIYDPETRRWRDGPDLPCDNSWGAAVDVSGTLLVAGGAHWSERHQSYFFDDRVWAFCDE